MVNAISRLDLHDTVYVLPITPAFHRQFSGVGTVSGSFEMKPDIVWDTIDTTEADAAFISVANHWQIGGKPAWSLLDA